MISRDKDILDHVLKNSPAFMAIFVEIIYDSKSLRHRFTVWRLVQNFPDLEKDLIPLIKP
jgi:hypothetical protein